MKNRTFEYVFKQVMWLLGTAAQLIASMGVGLKWVFMTFRCISFAMLDLAYFIPHVFWYLLSPNIIRRVSYRSSHTTKLRNLEALLSQQAMEEHAEPASGISFAWKDKKSSNGRESSPLPTIPDHDGGVDYEAVERFARTINPADGTFVNGLPVDITDDANNAASFFPGVLNMKNSFDDTLAALQRIYRHRSQQQQREQQQQMSKSTSMNVNGDNKDANEASDSAAADTPPSPLGESFTDSDNDDDVEDRMNLHNRAMLDIYLPIPLDSLFRFMDQERKSGETNDNSRATTPRTNVTKRNTDKKKGKADAHRDAAQHKSRLTRKKFPILISVNGGAWIVGCYLWNFLIARLFAARGYVVFCPDYRNFPQTTMEGMTLDVSDAVGWVLSNAERYNGDLNNVTLIGQSAGAHLTMMSLLSQAQQCAYNFNQENGLYADVPAPSKMAYNVPRYNPRESIHRYVGLSGIYNLSGLVRHFDRRGLYRNVLQQIAGGKASMPRFTLNSYFDDHPSPKTGEVLPDNIFNFFPQRMFFVHGDADKSAPVTESANIVYLMRNAQRDNIVKIISDNPDAAKTLPKPVIIEYILVPGATHTDSIIEEPLCGNSHIVEFLCYYDVDDDQRRHAQLTGKSPSAGALESRPHSRTGSVMVTSASPSDATLTKLADSEGLQQLGVSPVLASLSKNAEYEFPVLPASRPDGILLSPCPSTSRRKLMRLASFICPF